MWFKVELKNLNHKITKKILQNKIKMEKRIKGLLVFYFNFFLRGRPFYFSLQKRIRI